MFNAAIITGGIAIGAVLAPVFTSLIDKIYTYKTNKFNFQYRLISEQLKQKENEYLKLKQAVEGFIDTANHVLIHQYMALKNPKLFPKDTDGFNVYPYNQEVEKFLDCTYKLRILINDQDILSKMSSLVGKITNSTDEYHIQENLKSLDELSLLINKLLIKKSNEINRLNEAAKKLLK